MDKGCQTYTYIHSREKIYSSRSVPYLQVDLGSVFKSPTDNGNVALILKDLKAYMPCDEGEATPLCVFGNKRSVERMVCAKDVMSCFSEKEDRLDGLEPCVTDYGRQILLAQVWDGFAILLTLFI